MEWKDGIPYAAETAALLMASGGQVEVLSKHVVSESNTGFMRRRVARSHEDVELLRGWKIWRMMYEWNEMHHVDGVRSRHWGYQLWRSLWVATDGRLVGVKAMENIWDVDWRVDGSPPCCHGDRVEDLEENPHYDLWMNITSWDLEPPPYKESDSYTWQSSEHPKPQPWAQRLGPGEGLFKAIRALRERHGIPG